MLYFYLFIQLKVLTGISCLIVTKWEKIKHLLGLQFCPKKSVTRNFYIDYSNARDKKSLPIFYIPCKTFCWLLFGRYYKKSSFKMCHFHPIKFTPNTNFNVDWSLLLNLTQFDWMKLWLLFLNLFTCWFFRSPNGLQQWEKKTIT